MLNLIDTGAKDYLSEEENEHMIEAPKLKWFADRINTKPNKFKFELVEFVKHSDQLLKAPFNFYNFSLRLNLPE